MSKQDDLDNHANQMNPNNDEFFNSRGLERSSGSSTNSAWEDDDDDDLPEELFAESD